MNHPVSNFLIPFENLKYVFLKLKGNDLRELQSRSVEANKKEYILLLHYIGFNG